MNDSRTAAAIAAFRPPRRLLALAAAAIFAWLAQPSFALPLFARQTGQNCVACHAGGQFPELTPYGRIFKMTGYTIGERTIPLAAMAVISNSRVRNTTTSSDDPSSDFSKNGQTLFATASLFTGGKITDNVGAFAQVTYDPYATQDANGAYHGHSNADNIDLRFADRFVSPQRDLIYGLSLNNNPSVSDPWNTAAAWMQYVPAPSPSSSQFIDANTPYPSYGAGSNIAGLTAYAFLNRTWYGELGAYASSNGALSIMHAGVATADQTKLRGLNPYWRLAWNHEWGPHSLMLGTSGMSARIYDDPTDTSDPSTTHSWRNLMLEAQYQYLLDPHSITALLVYEHTRHGYPGFLANQPQPDSFVDQFGNPAANTNSVDTTNLLRAKFTYVYQAKYGGSVGFFNLTGSTNTAAQTAGYGSDGTVTTDPAAAPITANFTGNPATQGATLEAFWTPIQYVRIGAQYTAYSKFNGASTNYNGLGRNARDNNSLFIYLWAAY